MARDSATASIGQVAIASVDSVPRESAQSVHAGYFHSSIRAMHDKVVT